MMSFYNRLYNLGLTLLATPKVFASPALEKPDLRCNQQDGPFNAGFETGNLRAGQVIDGEAFGNNSITDSLSYSGGAFNQNRKYVVLGTAQAGESAVGRLKSGIFRATSALSFLVGGGYDSDNLYVGLVREREVASKANRNQ